MGLLLMANASDMILRVVDAPRNPHETNGCSNNLSLLFLQYDSPLQPYHYLLTSFTYLLTYFPSPIYYLPYLLNTFCIGQKFHDMLTNLHLSILHTSHKSSPIDH